MRPLIESGAVRLFPWELLIKKNTRHLREGVEKLQLQPELLEKVSTTFSQSQYNLGIKVGAIGIKMQSDPSGILPPGAELWLVDKIPILFYGLLNTIYAEQLGANYTPDLPGDRVIHDYIQSGGELSPTTREINTIQLPMFSEALWPDIVAIRKDSELVNILREIINDAANIQEEKSIASISQRLEEAALKIKEDTSIAKLVQGKTIEYSIAGFGGFLSAAITGASSSTAAEAGFATAAGSLLWSLYTGTKGQNQARSRLKLILNINQRL